MSLYIAGDIQGCFDELIALLAQVNFNQEEDQLWLAGDLVARGPKSLETLRYIKSLGTSANFVLGNHDLHLLAVHAGLKKSKPQDHLHALLKAPDYDELMDWLAGYPLLLALPNESGYLSHAGVSPQWSIKQAVKSAKFAQKKLTGNNRKHWLKVMYGEQPNSWSDVDTDEEHFRYAINTFTRMRFCHEDGSLDFSCKEKPSKAPKKLKPWFKANPILKKTSWVFGHWAALMGNHDKKRLYALDTGCVWGNHLTMIRWDDKKLFTQPAFE